MVSPPIPPVVAVESAARSRRGIALGHLQPFTLDVCANWREVQEESSTPLHDRALQDLHVLQAGGRVVLLNAPRAGNGKTHLLGRLAQRLSNDTVIASVPWHSAEDVSWSGCGHGVLHDLATGAARGVASLQTVCAGVLATLLRRLIQTGRVPSTDPGQALRVLAQDPMELFLEGGSARVIGDWFRRHFDQLRRPVAEISKVDDPDAVEDWLRGFFDYVDDPSSARLAELEDRMKTDVAVEAPRFLRLLAVWRPLVLVADHMDGLYRDPAAGVAVARMTLALASLPGVHVVLSVNQDLWETTFGRQLPSALEDRLNAHSITLGGLTAKDAEDLIVLRMGKAGLGTDDAASFLRFLDIERFFFGRPIGSVSARGLLRHASQMWRHWLLMDEVVMPDSGNPAVPPEGFLMEAVPGQQAPPAAVPALEEAEDMEKLAAHLAADSGGRVVSLSAPASPTAAPMTAPPPVVAPVAQVSPGNTPPFDLTSPVPIAQLSSPDSAPPAESLLPPHEDEPPAPASASPDAPAAREPGVSEAPPTTFHKLRQMLAKLKEGAESPPLDEDAVPPEPVAPPAHHGTNGTAAPVAANLQARYEEFRQEIANTPRPAIVELPVINDLVRLAGRRFPVINYDEVELPGLLGRSLPRWSLQGAELVFGLEDFADSRYWKTVSSFMAGRLAELSASTMGGGQAGAVQVKLVMFKGDAESGGLATLLREETIPPALRGIVDAVHLDPRSLASLYAMHQIVREAESGALQADTNAVLGTLASELDFFWKRVTRLKA